MGFKELNRVVEQWSLDNLRKDLRKGSKSVKGVLKRSSKGMKKSMKITSFSTATKKKKNQKRCMVSGSLCPNSFIEVESHRGRWLFPEREDGLQRWPDWPQRQLRGPKRQLREPQRQLGGLWSSMEVFRGNWEGLGKIWLCLEPS